MKLSIAAAPIMAVICFLGMISGCSENNGSSSVSDDSSAVTSQTVETQTTENLDVNDIIDAELTPLEFTAGIKVGWCLGNTLDATGGSGLSSETSWGNPKTTQELILAVKDAGFNAVRIPTTWQNHMDDSHNIDSEWMNRVRETVDYAYKNDMYVILNMHHEDWYCPYYDKLDEASEILSYAWKQIAENFKGYDERLIFEGMNEPRWKGTDMEWNGGNEEGHDVVNSLNKVFVDAVRSTGGNNEKRYLMICPYGASSSENALSALEIPDDDRIIVSVHAYIPYSFALAPNGSDKWTTEKSGMTTDIDNLADILDRLFISKGTAVIIGECGAMSRDNEEYRAEWASYYFPKFKKLGIPCFWWDNGAFNSGETFGLFNRIDNSVKFPSLAEAIVKGAE